MLMTYKEWQKEESKYWYNKYKNSKMVFTRPDGGFIDSGTFHNKYVKILEKAEVKRCTVYACHTFATRALEAGVPVKVVSNILGHSLCEASHKACYVV